jgi:two-component system response regulator YesN
LPALRENFLRNLISGAFYTEQDVDRKLEFLNIPVEKGQSLIVTVLQVDNYKQISDLDTEEDRELLSFSILNIIEEIISEHNCGICFCMSENEFIMIFNQSTPSGSNYMQICEEISLCLNRFLKI